MRLRDPRLQRHAHSMRREPTPFEVILWRHLSNSQLGGYKFRRQTVIEEYIVDFSCPKKTLAVEVDGETHDAIRDRIRDDYLAALGVRTLRFTNGEVRDQIEGVLDTILSVLDQRVDRFR